MRYMLLLYANQAEAPQFTPEERQALMQDWVAFQKEAEDAGVLVSNDGLAPVSDAMTVRFRNGETIITDGPFAETHEQLGGYFMLDCQDMGEAIGWAARMPHAKFGSVEVRRVMAYRQGRPARDGRTLPSQDE